MATKKDHQQWLKEWKAYEKAVSRYVKRYAKDVQKLPPGEVTTKDGGPGGDRPEPPKFP